MGWGGGAGVGMGRRCRGWDGAGGAGVGMGRRCRGWDRTVGAGVGMERRCLGRDGAGGAGVGMGRRYPCTRGQNGCTKYQTTGKTTYITKQPSLVYTPSRYHSRTIFMLKATTVYCSPFICLLSCVPSSQVLLLSLREPRAVRSVVLCTDQESRCHTMSAFGQSTSNDTNKQ